jgi:hypothetical protein
MKSDDYFWLIIEQKKHKTPTHKHPHSPRSNGKIITKNMHQNHREDIAKELEKQNRILRKENAIMFEYFSKKGYIEPKSPQHRHEVSKTKINISREYGSSDKERAETSTAHSPQQKKLLTFGRTRK